MKVKYQTTIYNKKYPFGHDNKATEREVIKNEKLSCYRPQWKNSCFN